MDTTHDTWTHHLGTSMILHDALFTAAVQGIKKYDSYAIPNQTKTTALVIRQTTINFTVRVCNTCVYEL